MPVRTPAVAGQFYESSPEACLAQIEQLLPAGPLDVDLPARIYAGIVPHAGWVFSGDLAALVISAVKQQLDNVDTFVIFGAVHAVRTHFALLYETGHWNTPLGSVEIDEPLAEEIRAEAPDLIRTDCASHQREHSIEVQVPIIQHLFPEARIVPLLVPPTDKAPDVGRAVAHVIQRSDKTIVCIGSTDLTHYGPSYYFTPHGVGSEALQWAKQTNDKFFLDLALSMQADRLVDTAQTYSSSCGAGATAAAVSAAQELGADRGYLLAHTTSAEVMSEKYGRSSTDSVGYAAIVLG